MYVERRGCSRKDKVAERSGYTETMPGGVEGPYLDL